jgi:hypothetical protein
MPEGGRLRVGSGDAPVNLMAAFLLNPKRAYGSMVLFEAMVDEIRGVDP